MAKKRKNGDTGGQGGSAAQDAAPAPVPASSPVPMAALLSPGLNSPTLKSGWLKDQHHLKSDMRMLRALLRNPCYIPPSFFEEAANDLMILSRTSTDDRVKVGAIKTVAEIAKLNLKVNEVANGGKDDQADAGQAVQVKVIINMPDAKPQPKAVEAVVSNG